MLPLQLLRARESFMRRFRPVLHEAGFTETQWRALRVLQAHDTMSFADLSHNAVIAKPSLSRIVSRLEGSQLIRRTISDDTRGTMLIHLTPNGEEAISALTHVIEAEYQRISEELGDRRLLDITALLADITSALDTGGGAIRDQ